MATSLAVEAAAVVEATGSHRIGRSGIALALWRGHDVEAHALTEASRQEVVSRGEGLWLTAHDWGTAVFYNALGRYDHALATIERAAENPDGTGLSMWVAAEFIEAAVRSGNAERAVGPLARLTEIAEANGTDWSLGLRAARAAMLAEGEAAEHLYREAIERLSRTRIRVATARAHLLYGEWLRRENRRVDAREHLRVAHELFGEMGNEPFAERARRELLATGETVRKRTVETLDDLTPQETQIGRMAADGFTNPEIGAQLFLSPRTVEWHLRKVFGKLGISSRRELRSALPGRPRRGGAGLAAADSSERGDDVLRGPLEQALCTSLDTHRSHPPREPLGDLLEDPAGAVDVGDRQRRGLEPHRDGRDVELLCRRDVAAAGGRTWSETGGAPPVGGAPRRPIGSGAGGSGALRAQRGARPHRETTTPRASSMWRSAIAEACSEVLPCWRASR